MKTIMMQFLDELKKDGYNIPLEHYNSMLEIEKEQIKIAFESGWNWNFSSEKYYNEIYGE